MAAFVTPVALHSQAGSLLQISSVQSSSCGQRSRVSSGSNAASRFAAQVDKAFKSAPMFASIVPKDINVPKLASDGGAGNGGSAGNGGRGGGDGEGEGEEKKSGVQAIWAAYEEVLKKQPLLTKSVTSFVGFALGDILAQNFLKKEGSEGFDWARLLRLSSFGFVVHAPTGHWFYGNLDNLIKGNGIAQVASKVAIDQVLWAPIFTFMFFTYTGLLEGKSVSQIVEKIKNDTVTAVTGSWKVWPIAHAINFRFISTENRILYINSIQIFYNVFLSWLASKDSGSTKEEGEEGADGLITEEKEDKPADAKADKKKD